MSKLLKTCECGCGEPAPIATRTRKESGWVKGEPIKYIKGHRGKVKMKCSWCGKDFEKLKHRKTVTTCSRKCGTQQSWSKREHSEGHLTESDGYFRIKLPDHPDANKDGYVSHHRYIVEQHLGYILDKSYDVHHIDLNRKNNDVSNLVAIKKSAHMYLHAILRRRDRNARRTNR